MPVFLPILWPFFWHQLAVSALGAILVNKIALIFVQILATAAYGSQHTKYFAKLLKQLPTEKESHLITFLADVENHHSCAEYQGIIDHLKRLQEQGLAMKFEEARKKRQGASHG